ncbi:DUF4166 domain-containing protein [Actinokineospora spheciospongiae]|uniref:DUF4166 domain-containing protein n=1 Tax=Actinokineospora spheciospongiae TaxID=909613 RepID=UPI000D71332E|nr:DUF4166 domain-containing protein [Actinokineospora spheciospongiae]PWW66793.1 uncharacterized protein DUF4166 [Actinokineospora spheciospongiae]
MTSIFRRALGGDFDRLHPRLRERFGFAAGDGRGCVGTGVMRRIWPRAGIARPLLALGASRNILFPEQGTDIPFTIENHAYLDRYGRDTLTFVRTFEFPHRRRRFDATMVYNDERGCVVDYLGTHQHVAVDLRPEVGERGELRIRSGEQRVRGLRLDVRWPTALTGAADVRESFDDELGRFRIAVRVTNPLRGLVLAYSGTFDVTYVDTTTSALPASVKPLREEPRG